jgi:hypothetical protein
MNMDTNVGQQRFKILTKLQAEKCLLLKLLAVVLGNTGFRAALLELTCEWLCVER